MAKRFFLFAVFTLSFTMYMCASAENAYVNVCNKTPYYLHARLAKNVPHSPVSFLDQGNIPPYNKGGCYHSLLAAELDQNDSFHYGLIVTVGDQPPRLGWNTSEVMVDVTVLPDGKRSGSPLKNYIYPGNLNFSQTTQFSIYGYLAAFTMDWNGNKRKNLS